MNVGERVKELREQRGMTQKLLAEKIGVTPAVICQIERGTKVPNVIIAKMICDNLGVTVDYLTGGKNEGTCRL